MKHFLGSTALLSCEAVNTGQFSEMKVVKFALDLGVIETKFVSFSKKLFQL